MIFQEETAAEARNRKSIQQCHVNRGWPFPNVNRRSRGCALVKKDAFSLLSWRWLLSSPNSIYSRWLPGCLPRREACCGLRPKNAINSPSRRSGEITDKVLSIIHTVPNLARINVCLRCVCSRLYVGACAGLNWRFMWPITIKLCLRKALVRPGCDRVAHTPSRPNAI